MFTQSAFVYQKGFVISWCNNLKKHHAMNITEKVNTFVEYLLSLINKLKGYIEDVIAFFEELRDKIEGLLEYVEGKIQSIEGFVGELKQHGEEEAAA